MAETPSYRVMSVDPKQGNIDDQFALIETQRGFGAPASDPSMRKIVVGDSLPEGEVTAITAEGIQVIPDEGDEYVIPLGGREGYKPPERKKPETLYDNESLRSMQEMIENYMKPKMPGDTMGPRVGLTESQELRMQRLNEAAQQQGQFYDTDDPKEIVDLVQKDFSDSFENDKTVEMYETPEGMNYLFKSEDGTLSSYFVDHEGDAIRTTPEAETVAAYNPPESPSSVIRSTLNRFTF